MSSFNLVGLPNFFSGWFLSVVLYPSTTPLFLYLFILFSHLWSSTVEDRAFNDQRYNMDCLKLRELGWAEEMAFEEGLKITVEWFLAHSTNWGDIEGFLNPHPKDPTVVL